MVVNVKKTMMAAAGGGGYWYARFGDNSNRYDGQQIYIDSNDDIFVGWRRQTSPDRMGVLKTDVNATLYWSRELEWDQYGDGDVMALDEDSSGYLILGGTARNGNFYVYAELNKSNGTVNSHQGFQVGTNNFRQKPQSGPVIDNNDDAWFVCTGEDDGNGRAGTAVWDHSTSTFDYNKEFTGMNTSTSYTYPNYITRTPNRQRIFFACYDPGGNGQTYLAEGNTSFGASHDWAYGITNSGTTPQRFHADAGYIYPACLHFTFSPEFYGFEISKIDIDSPSSRSWAKLMQASTLTGSYPRGLTTDSSGNVYVATRSQDATTAYIHKWNSSGTRQTPSLTITCDGTNINFWFATQLAVDSSDNLYLLGYNSAATNADKDVVLFKIPTDFSISGTYGDFTFGTNTNDYTETTSSLTYSDDSAGLATGSVTTRTLDKVEAAAGLDVSVVSI